MDDFEYFEKIKSRARITAIILLLIVGAYTMASCV